MAAGRDKARKMLSAPSPLCYDVAASVSPSAGPGVPRPVPFRSREEKAPRTVPCPWRAVLRLANRASGRRRPALTLSSTLWAGLVSSLLLDTWWVDWPLPRKKRGE